MRARRIGLTQTLPGLVLLLAQAATAGTESPEETTKLNCGVNAIFVLHRLEGRSTTLDQLLSPLPSRHADGFSMAELATASASLGLPLEGVRFLKNDRALDRPAVAFLKDAKGGHFAVLRPVGTTETMVQVIDPPAAPWISDYDKVLSIKPWMGRILIPRPSWHVRYAKPLTAGLACLAVIFVVARYKRSAGSRRSSQPAGLTSAGA